jgi:hypothetical protein
MRVSHAHRPLVRELRGDDVAELAAALAGDVIGHVDALLDIAPGFGQDLAHLARHLAREVVFATQHDLAGPIEDLAALRRRVQAPRIRGAVRGFDGLVDVGGRGSRRCGDDLAVRRIDVLERLSGDRVDPAAVDVILQMSGRHGTPLLLSPEAL